MKRLMFYCCVAFLFLYVIPAQAADWRFPLGLSYASGLSDVKDLHIKNLEVEGYMVDEKLNWPIGLSFQPYVQFENGLGIGLGIGPMEFVLTNVSSFYNFPVEADLRYTFLKSAKTSPYVRLGARYSIASGDYVKSSSPGAFGAIGFVFNKNIEIEVAYDTSEIEFKNYVLHRSNYYDYYVPGTTKIKPYGLMISVMGIF
jgi:hypothetical protein